MRIFISVNIPEDVKKDIVKIQNSLPEFEGKKTETENLHLTLKFLGEIEEDLLEKVKERLKKIKFAGFETEVNEIGFFSPKFIKIIWLRLSNCEELQSEIDLALKDLFKQEERFMGHLTIARIKNIKNKKEFLEKLSKIKVKKESFVVDNFFLMKSELKEKGPVYNVIEEFSLRN
jgi:2'-5' RNA ligase